MQFDAVGRQVLGGQFCQWVCAQHRGQSDSATQRGDRHRRVGGRAARRYLDRQGLHLLARRGQPLHSLYQVQRAQSDGNYQRQRLSPVVRRTSIELSDANWRARPMG